MRIATSYQVSTTQLILNIASVLIMVIHASQLVYLVFQVAPADQCLPSLLCFLGLHLDHLVLLPHLDHPFLVGYEQSIYWVWSMSCHW